uniref:Uncharacterized protein n=1 Tax=Ditylenchus dipsaci TaxID=166011 RepID=A0A915DAG0_9BILA
MPQYHQFAYCVFKLKLSELHRWLDVLEKLCEIDCERQPFTCINQDLYMVMADRLAEDGYKQDNDGKLVPDKQRFSTGIPALAKYIHKLGLKFAIYEDFGTKTCGGYPGSMGYLKS